MGYQRLAFRAGAFGLGILDGLEAHVDGHDDSERQGDTGNRRSGGNRKNRLPVENAFA